jgi:hypothetical protein
MPRKKTNLLRRGETREHRRWRVESLDSEDLRNNKGKKEKNGCFEKERVKVMEPIRGT